MYTTSFHSSFPRFLTSARLFSTPKITPLTSPTNPTLKHILSLHLPKNRKKHSQYIIEGPRAISSVSDKFVADLTVFVNDYSGELPNSLQYYSVPENLMKKITTTTSVIPLLSVYPLPPPPPSSSFKLITNGIQDPGNLGGLIRTLAATNLNASICMVGSGVEPFSPKVVRSSLGLSGVEVGWEGKFDGWMEFERVMDLSGCDWKVLVSILDSSASSIYSVPKNVEGLILGSEGKGVDDDLKLRCKVRPENYIKCYVPMSGNVESLNVGVAGGICLYEIAREKGTI
ncbi:hypothetical protein TL16_g00981 [Triparma laevis f. inornata]|uniref:tRNA/rRNA methyltransferase SpoU type domain-containing protein n=1 Tax=Triparma laevis f. inornata TaxID=1714386 RepID=A0A9W7DPH4_9STRA|nr:hypothetical protein TL16_g00981 [Triparma laevis f. inornata]